MVDADYLTLLWILKNRNYIVEIQKVVATKVNFP